MHPIKAPASPIVCRGDGLPVVFLHCTLSTKSQWLPLIEHWPEPIRAICVDLLGSGDAEWPAPADRHTLSIEAGHVEDLLAPLLPPTAGCHVVAHSFGAAVALKLAQRRRIPIRSLTLYEPTSFHLLHRDDIAVREVVQLVEAMQIALWRRQPDIALRRFFDYWNGAGAYAKVAAVRRQYMQSRLLKVMLDFTALLADPLQPRHLAEITTPLCLIGGQRSRRAPHHIMAVLASHAGADCRMHWVDATHMGPVSHPAKVANIAASFVGSVEQRRSESEADTSASFEATGCATGSASAPTIETAET